MNDQLRALLVKGLPHRVEVGQFKLGPREPEDLPIGSAGWGSLRQGVADEATPASDPCQRCAHQSPDHELFCRLIAALESEELYLVHFNDMDAIVAWSDDHRRPIMRKK